MPTLELKRDLLMRARERSLLSPDELTQVNGHLNEITPKIHTANVELSDYPLSFWIGMLEDGRLTSRERAIIARFVHGMNGYSPDNMQSIYSTQVSNSVEFGTTFSMLPQNAPNCEIKLHGRWYPVNAQCIFHEDERKVARDVTLQIGMSICDQVMSCSYGIYTDFFLDSSGNAISMSVFDVIARFGLRPVQMSVAEFNLRLTKAERQAREMGTVVEVSGSAWVVQDFNWYHGYQTVQIGSQDSPRRAVIEPELETSAGREGYFHRGKVHGAADTRLPFVRLFSFELKRYIYMDVDDIRPCEFDAQAIDHLALSKEMLNVLNRVFDTPTERIFGDLLRGKHGGIVVLASGNPGVGKTLTAEIYAERTERPLYVLEMGELGTNAQQAEERLSRVFTRVTRWNAVLQFDECEVFLAKRNQDLERSAIVGIFLRLLDYYQGMLFLTSNRPKVIDEAVLSRVMLRLNYPDLSLQAREEVWRYMFRAADMELVSNDYALLAEPQLNGRQIRNLTRLARILHASGKVTVEEMQAVIRLGLGNQADACMEPQNA